MAGIGFELRRLSKRDDLSGIIQAFMHSALVSAGPWLFTIVALAVIGFSSKSLYMSDDYINFHLIINYNFSFSLVLSAPVFMVVTRYLADNLYFKDATHFPATLIGSLLMVYLIALIPGLYFYLFYVNLSLEFRILALANLLLISGIWVIGVFLTAIKDYKSITLHFFIGMIIGATLGVVFKFNEIGSLLGFTAGILYISFAMVGAIFAEYPYRLRRIFDFLPAFRKYWQLALGGFFYNAAIWVDKWVMWFAPEAIVYPSLMRAYPIYETSLLLAYLTVIPAMALFLFSVETNFYERYYHFYRDILKHATLRKIKVNHLMMLSSVYGSSRNFIIFQGSMALLGILLAAQLLNLLNFSFEQIGILRIAILGSFFHILYLFLSIILSYFDCRNKVLFAHFLFLAINTVATIITVYMGFNFYGFGYFFASLVAFLVSGYMLFKYLNKLPYHSFITSNSSVK